MISSSKPKKTVSETGQNPDEIFDIVDASDNVVGCAPRSLIHKNWLFHRSVHAIVFDKSGKNILLQKRSMLKDSYPGYYTASCSGHVDSGEDYDTALLRETSEELGADMKISQFKKIGKIDACKDTGFEFAWVYTAVHEGPFEYPPHEVDSLEWMPEAEFAKLIEMGGAKITPAFVCVYKYFRSKCPL